MRQLPGAGDAQHGELDKNPPHDAPVGRFGLISKLDLTLLHCARIVSKCP